MMKSWPAEIHNTRLVIGNIAIREFLSLIVLTVLFWGTMPKATAQHSVARQWNETLLEAIRNDYARPTVHARNLYHWSVVTYDAWSVYEEYSKPYFLGNTIDTFSCPFNGVPSVTDVRTAQETAISYASYRLLKHRFEHSPGSVFTKVLIDSLFTELGHDTTYISTDYHLEGAAALGNYLAEQMISFGLQDGSNEINAYKNQYYFPRNYALAPTIPGNPLVTNINYWQPLSLTVFIDQSGNPLPNSSPPFLSPEWGDVVPFSLDSTQKTTYSRNGYNYQVYLDPGAPPYMDMDSALGTTDLYRWNHTLVGLWSSHLDPDDTVVWDISPASIGNITSYPTNFSDYPTFYNLLDGGDNSTGRALNPHTGLPYEPQLVKRGDYARVLAEFWADGPDSETPPGHWFTIMNYVMDHPDFTHRWMGGGPVIDTLDWDVQAYLCLGGTMHDAAIAAWSVKGWYDYARPISALRYMAEQGQCTDTSLANYAPTGIPLYPGLIETVDAGDTLAGDSSQHVGKIKINAWRGPDYLDSLGTDTAGVGWILVDNWWPYQRPTFVTPPFAGYVSGHSTYSRAAAEVLTMITGDPFFPGGMGEFVAEKDSFLVFEEGPSETFHLQWATYRDASDQCSLSRIWGGIHPPADDIPGRLMGILLGPQTVNHAQNFINGNGKPDVLTVSANNDLITDLDIGMSTFTVFIEFNEGMDTTIIPMITFPDENPLVNTLLGSTDSKWIDGYIFEYKFGVANSSEIIDSIDVLVTGAVNLYGAEQDSFYQADLFSIETVNPQIVEQKVLPDTITEMNIGIATFDISMLYNEPMDTTIEPNILFPNEDPLAAITFNQDSSGWENVFLYRAKYNVNDSTYPLYDIDIQVENARDVVGNVQLTTSLEDLFHIDGWGISATGIDFLENLDISIYPNPFDDRLYIDFPDAPSEWAFAIVDLNGRELHSATTIDKNISIEMQDFSSGIYFLKIVSEDQVAYRKVWKE